ncbi:MAG: class I SAM-dependent RNA methyltransferase [Candidatus Izemoplasmatales bacterium]|nr:class I SAM-dependent RNA methyltransferase [Candidatus Izemoplasmatales bacterium]MDD4068910.1 class I SAM-dependent RNA methyltransferase [Candidatus Izemoplasmatales bacterium]MDY0139137.1 class I SAM-dependent RNA methyltransferase [Candidatus Izemoplasmatales bacterium]
MKKYQLIATTTFGLEAIVKRELIDLGFEVVSTENGKVTFLSDIKGIVKANLWLRCADRVLLKVAEFKAVTFDELFDNTVKIDWSEYIPENGRFPVDGQSVKSTLFSISDSQAIVKKAIVEKLKKIYKIQWFPEDGPVFNVKVSILKDIATLTIDTSGVALHKRGYRTNAVTAPLKETLAAALVSLSFWNKDRTLIDPFCGSGTIAIEAALMAKNIAPGLSRDFAFKTWPLIDESSYLEVTREAYKAIDNDTYLKIHCYDISEENIIAAQNNADEAGVADSITFEVKDFNDLKFQEDYSILITNPPYGERLSEKEEVTKLYQQMAKKLSNLKTWSMYVITSDKDFEVNFNRKADRKRKLYNGRIETMYYQFYGENPKKNSD